MKRTDASSMVCMRIVTCICVRVNSTDFREVCQEPENNEKWPPISIPFRGPWSTYVFSAPVIPYFLVKRYCAIWRYPRPCGVVFLPFFRVSQDSLAFRKRMNWANSQSSFRTRLANRNGVPIAFCRARGVLQLVPQRYSGMVLVAVCSTLRGHPTATSARMTAQLWRSSRIESAKR